MLVPPAWGETEGAELSSVFSLLGGQCCYSQHPIGTLLQWCPPITYRRLRLQPTVYFESTAFNVGEVEGANASSLFSSSAHCRLTSTPTFSIFSPRYICVDYRALNHQ